MREDLSAGLVRETSPERRRAWPDRYGLATKRAALGVVLQAASLRPHAPAEYERMSVAVAVAGSTVDDTC